MVARSIFMASVLAAFANAQTIVTSSAASVAASSTVAQVMPPAATASFNPGNVSSTDAFAWCHAQLNNCPQICGGSASTNQCDQNLFTYSCICANGTVPDCTAYSQTLPFFICEATYSQCINNHPDDLAGQETCTKDQKCGTRNATAEALAATSAAAAASSTSAAASSSGGSGSGSASASSSAASSSSSGAATFVNSQQVANGALVTLLMAAFRLFL